LGCGNKSWKTFYFFALSSLVGWVIGSAERKRKTSRSTQAFETALVKRSSIAVVSSSLQVLSQWVSQSVVNAFVDSM
jgi:hypothetical protein